MNSTRAPRTISKVHLTWRTIENRVAAEQLTCNWTSPPSPPISSAISCSITTMFTLCATCAYGSTVRSYSTVVYISDDSLKLLGSRVVTAVTDGRAAKLTDAKFSREIIRLSRSVTACGEGQTTTGPRLSAGLSATVTPHTRADINAEFRETQ